MKRSVINKSYREALACFARHQWALPPQPRWDITDFGLGDFDRYGLALVNLAEEPEYCEKLMFARKDQVTPCHSHVRKKEDIICRAGVLTLRFWPLKPSPGTALPLRFSLRMDSQPTEVLTGEDVALEAGSRVTIEPGVWHSFRPASDQCIIGEVSTRNDDLGDNFFLDMGVGRFPGIDEDEPAAIRLLRE